MTGSREERTEHPQHGVCLNQVCVSVSFSISSDTHFRSRADTHGFSGHAWAQPWPKKGPETILSSLYICRSLIWRPIALPNFASELKEVVFQSENKTLKIQDLHVFCFHSYYFLYCFFMCLLHCAPTILCNQMAQERRTKATKMWAGRKGKSSRGQEVKHKELEIRSKLSCW